MKKLFFFTIALLWTGFSSFSKTLSLQGEFMQRIHLASDHAGFDLKATLAQHLTGLGYEVIDDGAYSKHSCDYPVFAHKLCEAV